MQGGKGIAIGFVAGLAVAGGAVLLLRDEAAAPVSGEPARIAELAEQVRRLDQSVSRLAALTLTARSDSDAAGASPEVAVAGVSQPPVDPARQKAEAKALVAATSMVDQALQMGQWTRAQQHEFNLLAENLDGDEHGRLMARIAAAINRNELQIELP